MARSIPVTNAIVVALTLLAGWLGPDLRAEPATFIPKSPLGECKAHWRSKGFSATGVPGKNSLFLPSGKETYDSFYKRVSRDQCFKEWTVVVYMAADNDLSPFSYRDLWEMESVGSSVSMDVVVFHDSASPEKMHYLHMAHNPELPDYSEALEKFIEAEGLGDQDEKEQEVAFLEAKGDTLTISPKVKELPEGDSGNVKTFAEFLKWAMARYPSRRLMVLGWSHGQGFDAPRQDTNTQEVKEENTGKQGGFAFDTFPEKSHMAVTEMAAEVRALLKSHRESVPLDIFGSDACLNQQVEFGFEWMGLAEYVFGSSTIVQKKGFNYRSLLRWFEEHPYHETHKLAAQVPILYGGSVGSGSGRKYSSYYDPYATMATWTMNELTFLRRAMDDVGALLHQWILEADDDLARVERVGEIRDLVSKSIRLGSVSQDLFNLLQVFETWVAEKREGEEAGPWNELRDELGSARLTLSRAVLSKYIGKKYVSGLLKTSQGVAVWLPASKNEFAEMYPKFAKSRFYQKESDPKELSSWARFVESLYKK